MGLEPIKKEQQSNEDLTRNIVFDEYVRMF